MEDEVSSIKYPHPIHPHPLWDSLFISFLLPFHPEHVRPWCIGGQNLFPADLFGSGLSPSFSPEWEEEKR